MSAIDDLAAMFASDLEALGLGPSFPDPRNAPTVPVSHQGHATTSSDVQLIIEQQRKLQQLLMQHMAGNSDTKAALAATIENDFLLPRSPHFTSEEAGQFDFLQLGHNDTPLTCSVDGLSFDDIHRMAAEQDASTGNVASLGHDYEQNDVHRTCSSKRVNKGHRTLSQQSFAEDSADEGWSSRCRIAWP